MACSPQTPGTSAPSGVPLADGSPALAPRWLRVLLPAAIFAVTFVAFAPALHNGFVEWDDGGNLLRNPHYRGLGLQQLRWAFGTTLLGVYQPLSWLLFGAQFSLFGMRAWAYHLCSLILHALSAVVFFFVAVRLLRSAGSNRHGRSETAVVLGAAVASFVFAIHPLRVETAVWASGQPYALCCLMYLLTVHTYLITHGTNPAKRPAARWTVLSIVCCAAAMMSKGIAVTLPVVLVVLDLYPLRRLGGPTRSWFSPAGLRVAAEKLPFLLLAAATAVVGVKATESSAQMAFLETPARLALAGHGLAFYAAKTLAPVGLSPWYPLPDDFSPADARYLFSGAVVLAVTAALVMARRRCPGALAAWVCYAAGLAPILGLVAHGSQIAADRYSLFSCMGWALLVGGALAWLARRRPTSGRFPLRRACFFASAAGAFALGTLTWRQVPVWRDSVALWEHMVAVMPDRSIAHMNLGCALSDQQQFDRAVEHFQACLDLRPNDADALGNIGNARARQGRLDEALSFFRRALQAAPESARAHYDMGSLLLMTGRLDDAAASFRRALERDADHIPAWNNLAGTYLALGRPDDALHTLREALARAPDDSELRRNLAWILCTTWRADLRDAPEAVRLAQHASAARSDRDPVALNTLAAAYARAGRFDDAVRTARRAIALALEAGRHALADDTRRCLALYQNGRAYSEPRPPPGEGRGSGTAPDAATTPSGRGSSPR